MELVGEKRVTECFAKTNFKDEILREIILCVSKIGYV